MVAFAPPPHLHIPHHHFLVPQPSAAAVGSVDLTSPHPASLASGPRPIHGQQGVHCCLYRCLLPSGRALLAGVLCLGRDSSGGRATYDLSTFSSASLRGVSVTLPRSVSYTDVLPVATLEAASLSDPWDAHRFGLGGGGSCGTSTPGGTGDRPRPTSSVVGSFFPSDWVFSDFSHRRFRRRRRRRLDLSSLGSSSSCLLDGSPSRSAISSRLRFSLVAAAFGSGSAS